MTLSKFYNHNPQITGENPPSPSDTRQKRRGSIGSDERHTRPGRHQHGDKQKRWQHHPIRNSPVYHGHQV